MMETNYATEII